MDKKKEKEEEIRLAEIDKKLPDTNLGNINAVWSDRYGWHLKRKEVSSVSNEQKLLDI